MAEASGITVIYHNPKCGTSRKVLALLEERGVEHEVVRYLDAPLSCGDLEAVLDMIADEPTALVRRDKRFKELGLAEGEVGSRGQVLRTLGKHPELMQRPVLVRGGEAVIARPVERAAEFLGL